MSQRIALTLDSYERYHRKHHQGEVLSVTTNRLPLLFSPDADFKTMTSKWPAVWVKITSSWVCLLLYLWTLVAPLVLTNRDFS